MSDTVRVKTLEFIRNNPERWNQWHYVSNADIRGLRNKTVDCGTSFCLAGTAAYMTPVNDWVGLSVDATAIESLDISRDVADSLFSHFHNTDDGTNYYRYVRGGHQYVTHEAFVDLLERLFSQTDDTITNRHMLNVLPDWEKDNNVGYRE